MKASPRPGGGVGDGGGEAHSDTVQREVHQDALLLLLPEAVMLASLRNRLSLD